MAESDPLTQDLHSKLGTSDLPLGWEWAEGQLRFQGHLYIPNQDIRCLQVIHNHHDHPLPGHLREPTTSKLIHCTCHCLRLQRMVHTPMARRRQRLGELDAVGSVRPWEDAHAGLDELARLSLIVDAPQLLARDEPSPGEREAVAVRQLDAERKASRSPLAEWHGITRI